MIREVIMQEMDIRGDKMSDLSRHINVSYATIHNFIKKGWIRLEVLEKILNYYKLELIKRY